MSWDPNQPQGQQPGGPNPYNPQGQPPSGPNPYNQPPSGPNPYNPQGQQSGMPNPYNPQPQSTPNPYEQPSGQPGYGAPPTGYGAPGYEQPSAAFGYAPQAPRPWGQALQELPGQYIKILTKPGALSFIEEQPKATWGMVWTQLLIIGLIGTIVGIIGLAFGAAMMAGLAGGGAGTAYAMMSSVFIGSGSVYAIITTIIGFFIVVGIQYLLAKAFHGNGTFVQQGYNYLLFYTPIAVISSILGLIPILGGLIGAALGIYGLVLNVFSIMAAHRLSGGKATWVVLIPILAIILLALLCTVLLVALFASAFHAATTP